MPFHDSIVVRLPALRPRLDTSPHRAIAADTVHNLRCALLVTTQLPVGRPGNEKELGRDIPSCVHNHPDDKLLEASEESTPLLPPEAIWLCVWERRCETVLF